LLLYHDKITLSVANVVNFIAKAIIYCILVSIGFHKYFQVMVSLYPDKIQMKQWVLSRKLFLSINLS